MKKTLGLVIAVLVMMNMMIAAFVVMSFSVKRIEYAIFFRPYVEAEINALQIELSNVRKECFRTESVMMKGNRIQTRRKMIDAVNQ